VVGAAASTTGSNVEAATGPLADTGIVKTAVVGFNPENIISDALFYDGNAMSSAEINRSSTARSADARTASA
jgi:hypothetical protein